MSRLLYSFWAPSSGGPGLFLFNSNANARAAATTRTRRTRRRRTTTTTMAMHNATQRRGSERPERRREPPSFFLFVPFFETLFSSLSLPPSLTLFPSLLVPPLGLLALVLSVPYASLFPCRFLLLSPSSPPPPFFPFLVSPSIIPITRPDPAKIVSAVLDFAYGSFQQRDATAPRPSSVQVHRPGSVQVALPSR